MSQRYEPTCFVSTDKKVYHRIGLIDNDFRFYTGCGKPVDSIWGIKSIDRKRADMLGRPCSSCFKAVSQ